MVFQDDGAVVILVGGGHSSGKSCVCQAIKQQLESSSSLVKNQIEIQLVDMNKYLFKPLLINEHVGATGVTPKISADHAKAAFKANHPTAVQLENSDIGAQPNENALDNEQTGFVKLQNKRIALPSRFDFQRLISDLQDHLSHIYVASQRHQKLPVFLIHGLYALYNKQLNDLALMKIFIDVDADTRLVRWVQRDTVENHYPLEAVIEQYMDYARPEFSEFIFPTKEHADTILTRGADVIGVSLICDGIIPLISHKLKRLDSVDHEASDVALYPYKASTGGINKEEAQEIIADKYTKSTDTADKQLDVRGLPKLNIKGEQFTDQRGRFYDLT